MYSKIPDATNWLSYFPERMDTKRALWFVQDILDVDVLRDNAVALHSGAGYQNIKDCESFLSAFPSVFLALADSELVDIAEDAFAEFAPSVPILKPAPGVFRGHANILEVFTAGGQEAVDRLIIGAVERPAAGLLDLADVERQKESQISVLSGIRDLDKAIGGFYPGELSVWTGKRGGGKSTLLGQLLLEALDQGFPVCAYSGELPAWRFKQWVSLQAAGPDHVIKRQDRFSEKIFYAVTPKIQDMLDDWWRGRFLLFDNRYQGEEDSILRMFEYAVRRYGACVFLVDNLMTTKLKSSERDFYRAQSNFTGRLVEFAKKYEVHVHLVAHPRKTPSEKKVLEGDDIGGTGDILNMADNGFSVTRLNKEDAQNRGYQTILHTLKNRSYGELVSVGLDYEETSRRFYKSITGDPQKRYGWELSK